MSSKPPPNDSGSQRRGSSSFLDRVRLAMHELAEPTAAAEESKEETAVTAERETEGKIIGFKNPRAEEKRSVGVFGHPNEKKEDKKADASSPKPPALFGRLVSAIRYDTSPPSTSNVTSKRGPSLVDAVLASASKVLESQKMKEQDNSTHPATAVDDVTEEAEGSRVNEAVDEKISTTSSAEVAKVSSDATTREDEASTGQVAAPEAEDNEQPAPSLSKVQEGDAAAGSSSDSIEAADSVHQEAEDVEPAPTRLFGRLISAMSSDQLSAETTDVPPEKEGEPFITATSETPVSTSENYVEPAPTSIFDRLISTVRNEVSAPVSTESDVAHSQISVGNTNSSSDTDSKSEAAAIAEMVELTLDVGGEDQEETNDVEPSTAQENETVAETHQSDPSVTHEIDHVDEHYPEEELQKAVKRTGSALLSVLPSREASGVSIECFNAIERMKSDGEVLSMQYVKELETSGVLVTCSNNERLKVPEKDLAELRAAAAGCCTGRLSWTAVPELLALWSVVHVSISDGISDEAGEKANVLEPFTLAQAVERKGSMLNLRSVENEQDVEEVEVDNSLFDDQLMQAALGQAMVGLKGSLLVSRQRLAVSLQAMREGRAALVGGCLAMVNIPLLRFEIARDFFQTAGLFLSGMFKPTLLYFEHQQLPEYVQLLVKGLRTAYTIIAIDIAAFIQWISTFSDAGVFICIVFVMMAHLFFISWLYKVTKYMPRGADNVRHGHESITWASLAATNKRMALITSFLITASLTAYLPLTQFCFSVFDINVHKKDERPNIEGTVASYFIDKPYWGLIVFEAVALLLTFSLPLPFVLVSSIRSNRPRGSLENDKVTYDLDGEEVPFDDKVYASLVASDPSQLRCPYRSLYNGFEQRWSTYKVVQLVAKAILAVVVVASSRSVAYGGIAVCVIYFLIVLLTTASRPFIDPVNDLMESSAKFTALVTAIGGTVGAWAQLNDVHSRYIQGFLAFVLVVHFLNLWVMLTVTLLGVANTRTLIKNWLGWLSFSDTTRMIDDARAQDIIPNWELNKEAKHRVWQAFWRAVLYDLVPSSEESEQDEDQVKMSPAASRLLALEQAVISAGIRRVSSHWRGKQQRYTTRLRQVVRTALEGVDVYWNEDTGVRDGHLDSASCFGKMYVVPYPFHCVVVYDNSDDEAIIWDEVEESAPRDSKLHSNLAKLLFLNFSPAIVAKRELRQKIRALAAMKTPVKFPFSRVEKAVVTDYYEWTPIEGLRPVKIKYKAVVEFTCHYTYGVFKVKTSGDAAIKGGPTRAMADGFIVTMSYKDGRGYARAPRTGKRTEVTKRRAVRDSDHFGLNSDMEENEHLKKIFEETTPFWEDGIKKMRAEHRKYRRKLIEIHSEANSTLSDDFWYFVYNNQYLTRKDLEQYLTTREANPLLCQLPKTHEKALDALYLRQRFIMKSQAHKLWYIFWDDVYARNSGMSRLIPRGEPKPGRACRADFDPNSATSICYNKMNRADLEAWLKERGLMSKTGMFHPGLLQLLYDELRKLDEGADLKNIMKIRPGGKSFRRRSMIASMVWRPAA